MKKLLLTLFLLALLALNIQWHYDRMCATVFSPRAYFKLDGVYCDTMLGDKPLVDLLKRHKRVQEQVECELANPDKSFMCDPRWIPASNEESG